MNSYETLCIVVWKIPCIRTKIISHSWISRSSLSSGIGLICWVNFWYHPLSTTAALKLELLIDKIPGRRIKLKVAERVWRMKVVVVFVWPKMNEPNKKLETPRNSIIQARTVIWMFNRLRRCLLAFDESLRSLRSFIMVSLWVLKCKIQTKHKWKMYEGIIFLY